MVGVVLENFCKPLNETRYTTLDCCGKCGASRPQDGKQPQSSVFSGAERRGGNDDGKASEEQLLREVYLHAESLRAEADQVAKEAADRRLRDEFAMAALTGIAHAMVSKHGVCAYDTNDAAQEAYYLADAMMKARG